MKLSIYFLSSLMILLLGGGLLQTVHAENTEGQSNEPSSRMESAAPVSRLQVIDKTIGTGAEAKKGKEVTVQYTGMLYPSGEKFDSSLDHGEPFSFKLGAGQVIKGWDKGVAGMKVGGKRTLLIPPDLAYGSEGVPNVIPPNAPLKFDIELLNVK